MAPLTPNETTEVNRRAWNSRRFDTWVSSFGPPDAEGARIVAEPGGVLRRLSPYLDDVAGKRICSVQGSHGRVAVALARLGAKVEVVDFSDENRRYALALVAAADVSIDYAAIDVMTAATPERLHQFDALVIELGILRYHQDIDRFFSVIRALVANISRSRCRARFKSAGYTILASTPATYLSSRGIRQPSSKRRCLLVKKARLSRNEHDAEPAPD